MFPSMISVAPDVSLASNITKFDPVDLSNPRDLWACMRSRPWSPCVWKNNYRKEENFLFADWCALDFDSGEWSVSDAIEMLSKSSLTGLIGSTQSHKIPKKGQPACDRFRVVIPWESRIKDLRTYKQNMARLAQHLPVDPACKDGARFFWPCKELLHTAWGGPLSWVPYEAPPPKERRTAAIAHDTELGHVPPWMDTELRHLRHGERNTKLFRFAIRLKERGWAVPAVVEFFSGRVDLDRYEIEKVVRSAWRYG